MDTNEVFWVCIRTLITDLPCPERGPSPRTCERCKHWTACLLVATAADMILKGEY